MISISAPSYNSSEPIVSDRGIAELQSARRRASRIATLDGGAVLVDGGWADADRTYSISIPDQNGAHRSSLLSIITDYSTAILGCEDGSFVVLLSGLDHKKGKTTVTAEVLEAA